jgi:acyl carrier protein
MVEVTIGTVAGIERRDLKSTSQSSRTATESSSGTRYTSRAPTESSSGTTYTASNGAEIPDSEVGEVSLARHIIVQEMGIDSSELTDDADLSELGMDSLMSLIVLGELREKTGVDLPSTFLSTNSTILDIENALGMRPAPNAKAASAPKAANIRVEESLSEE